MSLTGIEDRTPPIEPVLAPATTDARPRLPLSHKIGYSSGQLVELVVGSMLNVFALYYATGVCGLPGALAGVALGAGLVIDAIMDPLIGSLSDGWQSRFGRRVPFMTVALIPLVISFNLIFALPADVGHTALFLWLMLLSITLRVSLSVFCLPYQALGVEMSDDYDERSSIAAWRWGIGILGTFAVIGLGYGVFLNGPAGISQRDGYLHLTLTLTLLLLLGAGIAIRTGLVARHRHHVVETSDHAALGRRLLGQVAEMFRNQTFRIVAGASLVLHVAQGINQALALHMGVFFWKMESTQLQLLSMAAVFGFALAAPLAGPLVTRMEKRSLLLFALAGMAVANSLPVALRVLNVLPDNQIANISVLGTMVFLGGIAFALSTIAFISIIPDAADEHEHLFGARREGLFFAGWSFANKSATGVGLLFGGVFLQLIDFPAQGAEQDVAMAIPQHTLNQLALVGGPGSGLIALFGIALMQFYRIDRAAHARIVTDLRARRGT